MANQWDQCWPHTARRLAARCLLGLALIAASCATSNSAQSSHQSVTLVLVTTDIWADVTANVACLDSASTHEGSIRIETLIPAGGDAHQFEPSLRDRTTVSKADLVIANGLGLEGGLTKALESARSDGVTVVELGERSLTESEAETEHEEHEDSHHEHDHGGVDPHIWFDPMIVAEAADAIAEELIHHAGLPAAPINLCTASYKAALLQADTEAAHRFNAIPPQHRNLVTNHDSLGYLAARYDLRVLGTVLPSSSSLSATNPASLLALGKVMANEEVAVIFHGALHPSAEAAALARTHETKLVELNTGSLGEYSSYLDWFEATTTTIATELASK